MQQQTPPEAFDLNGMAADLISLLRLRTTVIGIKMFATVEEMAAIPKIRRPSAAHTTDQIVSMASRLGWTVGSAAEDLVGAHWRGVISLSLRCFAERRYGGVPDEEMLMALQRVHLAKAIVGMKQLGKSGLRYPIAPYGIQADVRAGMGVSYAKK